MSEATEEKLDFGEGEPHVRGEVDEEDAVEGVAGVAALAAEALGRSEEAAFFVVADGGGVEVGASGELADFHLRLLSRYRKPWNSEEGLAASLRPEKRQQAAALQSARLPDGSLGKLQAGATKSPLRGLT